MTVSSRVPGRLERIERLLQQLHQKIDNFLRLRGTLGGGPERNRQNMGRDSQGRIPDPQTDPQRRGGTEGYGKREGRREG